MSRDNRLDLFAGPGRYKDGTKSTPLLVLEQAIADPDMRHMLVSIFNDADTDNSQSLEASIKELPKIETLKYQPKIYTGAVSNQIVEMFEKMKLVPTLFFVDPWGYKGLSLRLVNSVIKDWGSDCIFFFNYNRINMGLSNPIVEAHMDSLFGKPRADGLRSKLSAMHPDEREFAIIEELVEALSEMGGRYVLPFSFKNESGKRTSHHLIFVTKAFKGYEIMKGIMAKESSNSVQGVPSFEYSPATVRQRLLFDLSRPLDALEELSLDDFAGRTISMDAIYHAHNVGKPYIEKNYKDALLRLESSGKIRANPPANKRRHGTFGGKVEVTFPRKGKK